MLDEPTASLTRGEVDALFREVRRIAGLGGGVLFVSHVLEEVLELRRPGHRAARRQGRRRGRAGERARRAPLVELIVGRAVADLYPDAEHRTGRPLLEAEGVAGLTLRGVSFKIHAGEILGVAGLVGSGREEIAGVAVRGHAAFRRQGARRRAQGVRRAA